MQIVLCILASVGGRLYRFVIFQNVSVCDYVCVCVCVCVGVCVFASASAFCVLVGEIK